MQEKNTNGSHTHALTNCVHTYTSTGVVLVSICDLLWEKEQFPANNDNRVTDISG